MCHPTFEGAMSLPLVTENLYMSNKNQATSLAGYACRIGRSRVNRVKTVDLEDAMNSRKIMPDKIRNSDQRTKK
jgi:hypothetical protein